jgi:hypothetical protein
MNAAPAQATPETATKQLDKLSGSINQVLKLCYDALAPGKTQEERNALRERLRQFIDRP